MKRKIISLIVTGALLLSTTGTAFAKEEVVVPFSGDGAEQSEEVDDEEIVDPFSGEGLEWGEEVENDGMAEPFSAEEIEQDPEVENDEVMPKEVTEDISPDFGTKKHINNEKVLSINTSHYFFIYYFSQLVMSKKL